MLITQKIGNLQSFALQDRQIDLLQIEWFETDKRILHKRSKAGREIIMKFTNEPQNLRDGDIVWTDQLSAIVIDIVPCESIVIQPSSMSEMAAICYEIGNKHLPLFYSNNTLQIPYDAPLFNMLTALGYRPAVETLKLADQLRTTVSPHTSNESKQTLFSKILQLTTPS